MIDRRFVAGALALALSALVAACSGSPGTGAPASPTPQPSASAASAAPAAMSATVTIQGFAFNPQNVTVKAGGTVTWTNQDAVIHTATSDTAGQFDTGNLSPNATSAAVTFATPGTFPYHCAVHTTMRGTVTVVP